MKPYMEKEGNDQKENEMGIKLKKKKKKRNTQPNIKQFFEEQDLGKMQTKKLNKKIW